MAHRTKSILASQFPEVSGCYIIRDGEQVLYVGQSKNMRKRWMEHHLRNLIEGAFPNAKIDVVLCGDERIRLEIDLIEEFKPTMNGKKLTEVLREHNIVYGYHVRQVRTA